jgi:hypothetical protein
MANVSVNTEEPLTSTKTLDHLEEILRSPSFISSPRCQQFLRFVVREVIEGRTDTIKERTIALEVFGKSIRFDPGSDSLVRVKAREVRKRLAEFYECTPNVPLRVELPLGSYVPIIRATPPPEAPFSEGAKIIPTAPDVGQMEGTSAQEQAVASKLTRRRAVWLFGASLGAFAAASTMRLWHHTSSKLDLLWKPVFAKGSPLLIFIPLLTNEPDQTGAMTDRVGMGTAAAVSQAAQYLTEMHHPYRLRFGADLTFSQLREQPSLLLGGFSSQWTTRMTSGLRFILVDHGPNQKGAYVRDTQTGHQWGPVISENGFADLDYSLLCRLFDENSGQIIFIAAGITTFGTQSAASFLFSDDLFPALLKNAPSDWNTKNFQAVIQTTIIGVTPSTPHVVDTYFW